MRGTITGKVRLQSPTGLPFAGAVVQAYNQADLNNEVFLNEAATDSAGNYRIAYEFEPSQDPQRRKVNLVLRVFDSGGTLRGEASLPDAPSDANVDVIVGDPVRLSEIERIEEDLSLLKADEQYRQFSDDQINFLSRATDIDPERLAELRRADQIACDTGLYRGVACGMHLKSRRHFQP
jgi:hypothetical protein